MQLYNIALVFDNKVSDMIISYATKLYEIMNSDVILGRNSHPHMTIAQFEVEKNQAKEIWDSCTSSLKDTPDLTFSGLTILPSSKGGAWLEISILKSNSLLAVQDTLKTIIEPYGSLSNASADAYRPHVTLAHTTSANSLNSLCFSYEPLRLKSVKTALDIGIGTLFDPNEKPLDYF